MDCSLLGSSICGIFLQEYWSGVPLPSPGDLPNPRVEPGSPALQTDPSPSEPPGKTLSESLYRRFSTIIFIIFPFDWFKNYIVTLTLAQTLGDFLLYFCYLFLIPFDHICTWNCLSPCKFVEAYYETVYYQCWKILHITLGEMCVLQVVRMVLYTLMWSKF